LALFKIRRRFSGAVRAREHCVAESNVAERLHNPDDPKIKRRQQYECYDVRPMKLTAIGFFRSALHAAPIFAMHELLFTPQERPRHAERACYLTQFAAPAAIFWQ
jgi:hypothetical protein